MYLSRKSYVKNWNHMQPNERHEVTVLKNGLPRADIKPERVSYVIEEVAYWRKANQIHKWFVDNVQNGKDECQESCVDVSQLKELVALCKQVLEASELVAGQIQNGSTLKANGSWEPVMEPGKVMVNAEVAQKLLPSQGGFFFGGTDYDQFYIQDLQDTVKMLEPLLDDDQGEYYYHASW